MGKIFEQKQKIENLRESILKAKEKALEIASILEKEQLPDSGLFDQLGGFVKNAQNLEIDILAGFPDWDREKKGTVTDFLNHLNKLSIENERKTLLQALYMFTRIYSDDPAYDESLNEYRAKASQYIEELESITEPDKLTEIKPKIDIFIVFVNLLEKEIVLADDPLLETLSEKNISAKIYRGVNIGKYQIKAKGVVKTKIPSVKPIPPSNEQTKDIVIISNRKIKINLVELKGNLEKIPDSPALILSCATWLIYFTAAEMVRLIKHFPDHNHSDEEIRSSIETLTKFGYFTSFRLSDQEITRYVLNSDLKNAFANKIVWKAVKDSGKSVEQAMKGYYKNLSSVTRDDVISVEERNKAYLNVIDYIRDNYDEKLAWDKIIKPLDCNIYCYYTGEKGVVLLSKAMLESLKAGGSEHDLVKFIQKNTDLILLLIDDKSVEETVSLAESCFPERKYLLLPQFCGNKSASAHEEKAPEPEAISATPSAIQEDNNQPKDESLNTPEDIAKCLAEIDCNKEEARFFELCDKLISSLKDCEPQKEENAPDRIVQALIFLHALSLSKLKSMDKKEENDNYSKREKYKNKSIQFQLATNLKLDDGAQYNSETLGTFFPDDEDIHLKISAFLRAMFAPDNEKDYPLYVLGDQLADQLDNYPPSLKGILKDLVELRNTERGFSAAVLNHFADQTIKQKRDRAIAAKAGALKKGPNISAKLSGIPEFTELCFGKKSDIYDIMDSIENSVPNMRELIQDIVDELKDRSKIENYIAERWNQVKNPRVLKLENNARKQSVSWLEKQRDLMQEYLKYSESEKVNISQEIIKIHETFHSKLTAAITSIPVDKAENSIICNALKYINEANEVGIAPDATWDFSEFLYSSEVELDENNIPKFPLFFDDLPGMEAWRSVARHIAEKRIYLPAVLQRIKDDTDKYYFDNFAHGQKIEEYLIVKNQMTPDKKVPWDSNEKAAREYSKEQEKRLVDEMEGAFAYGRIKEQEKEYLLELKDKFSNHFAKCKNYGHFNLSLSKFHILLEEKKGIIEEKLRKQFDNCIAKPKIDKDCPLAKEIEKLLKNASFNVAEDYINRLESGEKDLPSDQGYDEIDSLGDFLEKWEGLNKLCQQNKNRSLKNWGPENLHFNSNWTVRQKDSSRRLLENWPSEKHNTNNTNIQFFFEEIGFTIEKSEKIYSDTQLIFAVSIKPPDLNQPDYRHPIAAFGTYLAQSVKIICLFGNYAVTDLNDIIINQLHLGDNSIVLYNTALKLEDRRKLIADFHNNYSGRNNFLLIDQVLALYLATLDISERMPAMLKTTLPFSSCQPFNQGSGLIPDEMFFGRKTELADILSNTGTNIVYGGRQLGKSALLFRAKSIAHRPENSEYAIYVDIKDKEPNEAVHKIYEEIIQAKIPLRSLDNKNWEDLVTIIRNSIEKGKVKRLLVLIDEADKFLEKDEKDGFKMISLLINLGRQTRNRFKFVLAGLHNVARSKNAIERNGIFPQMPESLCIHPLSPMDASNLLKRPLLYLGFRKDHLKDLWPILAITNYYPGILHFFGHILINTVLYEQYRNYYNAEKHPPYDLTENELRRIISDNRLNSSIKEKINLTLGLDQRYKILANIIAYQYYLDEHDETYRSKGYSVDTIRDLALSTEINQKENLTFENIRNLLSEMADMGILWENKDEGLFRLRRSSFLGTIGSLTEVENYVSTLDNQGFVPS